MTKSRKRTITTSTGTSQSTLSPLMIGGVVMAAVIVVVGLILLGNQTRSGGGTTPDFDLSSFPTKGSADAPVTFIDFSNYG